MITVKTASGRKYDIDLEAKTITREGDAQVYNYKGEGYADPHHKAVNTYTDLDVNEMGRLVYRLAPVGDERGEYWTSSRIVDGLPELVKALDS